MSARKVHVLSLGVSNRASMYAGLEKAGGAPEPADSPETVRAAALLVVPGVGSFGAGMERLRADGSDEALRERIRNDRPTLLVCLGMQLLGSASEESPGTRGLGVIDRATVRFPGTATVPQMGWNRVRAGRGENRGSGRYLIDGDAYFANSYCLREAPDDGMVAWSEYEGPFVAAWSRGSLLACQFHPELSGAWGIACLRRWLQEAAVPSC